MSYIEFKSQISALSDVKCFWALEEDASKYNQDAIVPDSSVELIINYGAPLFIQHHNQLIELPRVFLKGVQKTPLRLQVSGDARLIGVRLYPWTISSLFDQSPHTNDLPIIPLNDLSSYAFTALNSALLRGGKTECVALLHEILYETQSKSMTGLNSVRTAGHLISHTQGRMRIENLADACALSISQLERQFKSTTGISPKAFARLVRFEAIRDTLVSQPTTPLTELAHTFGYTDQAHFIHDFKAFADRTPGAFVGQGSSPRDAEFLQSS